MYCTHYTGDILDCYSYSDLDSTSSSGGHANLMDLPQCNNPLINFNILKIEDAVTFGGHRVRSTLGDLEVRIN